MSGYGGIVSVVIAGIAAVPLLAYLFARVAMTPRWLKRPVWSLLLFILVMALCTTSVAVAPLFSAGELLIVAVGPALVVPLTVSPLLTFVFRARTKQAGRLMKAAAYGLVALAIAVWGATSLLLIEVIAPLLVFLLAMIAWIPLLRAAQRGKLNRTYHYFVHAVLGGSLFLLVYAPLLTLAGAAQGTHGAAIVVGAIAWLMGFLPGAIVGLCAAYLLAHTAKHRPASNSKP